MKIAVLFDGAGLARLGLEEAGHTCMGVELDKWKHYLSQFTGSGNVILQDATTFDISEFDAVWASPPCQRRSSARTQGEPVSKFSTDYLEWSLALPNDVLWVENVLSQEKDKNGWGTVWNAAQFLPEPIQNRNRVVGGRYLFPRVYREYTKWIPNICPAVTATEFKGCASDKRRASRFYGRRLTLEECAYHQGLPKSILDKWIEIPKDWDDTPSEWRKNLYEAIGNGVPVYMAKAFGERYI